MRRVVDWVWRHPILSLALVAIAVVSFTQSQSASPCERESRRLSIETGQSYGDLLRLCEGLSR